MEDVNRSECHLRESPNVRIPTSHTIGRAIKELACADIEYKSRTGTSAYRSVARMSCRKIHIFLLVSYSLILFRSTSLEYSTGGVNGSEPLTMLVNNVHGITLFSYQPQICHPLLSLVNRCKQCSRHDKIKAPQILHGRNTLQKYVENRELPKSTQKVFKIKEC